MDKTYWSESLVLRKTNLTLDCLRPISKQLEILCPKIQDYGLLTPRVIVALVHEALRCMLPDTNLEIVESQDSECLIRQPGTGTYFVVFYDVGETDEPTVEYYWPVI